MDLGDGVSLPFLWTVAHDTSLRPVLTIHNGAESIAIQEVTLSGDSFSARMPLFDSEFVGVLSGDSSIAGEWRNYLKGDGYRVPFRAIAGDHGRFPSSCSGGAVPFAGKWAVKFSPETTSASNAVGEFTGDPDGRVTGTFLTETGDYRYLEGAACGDSMRLSCFDGSHAFLFACSRAGDTLTGRFWSGTHWQEPWIAVRNPDYQLRDPDSLTALREGFEEIDFSFADTEGVLRSPKDKVYRGKPLIVHIMGSWCPNCVDETTLLTQMHAKYHARGLNIMAVAFEKHDEEARAINGLKRFQAALNVPYPILYGGPAAKDQAAARLPFLNHIISYPTCIFLDRTGRVRRIRTGFSGPGTGKHYNEYEQKLDGFLQQLLAERL